MRSTEVFWNKYITLGIGQDAKSEATLCMLFSVHYKRVFIQGAMFKFSGESVVLEIS